MNGESAGPGLLAKEFASMTPTSDHMNAVQAQVQLTLELFVGLLNEGKTENGVAAEALLRSVFDSVINAVILAKHPEKLGDFIRHGKFSQMRQMRFTTELTPEMQKHVQSIITKTEPDWGALFKEFKNTDWHRLGTRPSFVEAEFNEALYDKYFRPASAYCHAEPYVLVYPADDNWGTWKVGGRGKHWKLHWISAYIVGCYAMIHMMAIMSREFKLGYEEKLKEFTAMADEFKQAHIDAIKAAFEDHYRATKNTENPNRRDTDNAEAPKGPI
jgi:hypothetical protein